MEIVPSLNACQKYMRKNIKREKEREGERKSMQQSLTFFECSSIYIFETSVYRLGCLCKKYYIKTLKT
jgi:hypothetical protein